MSTLFLALLKSTPGVQVLEVLVWSVPCLLAARLAWQQRKEGLSTWAFVSFITFCFALDKAVDLHAILHGAGKALVFWIDPETRLRGPLLGRRGILLGSIFLCGLLLGRWLLRRDRSMTGPKRTSLLGLVIVMAYLGIRLMPSVGHFLGSTPAGWWVEAIAWGCVVGGELWASRQNANASGTQSVGLPR